ncbi:hypothetical protein AX774_g4901 [Zancudomyces culisetae]|uniref:Uncharacterized protein n=1 Tax=Zancudomyces culisetae TaxID=1213189 RepID=A0A1R1PKY4_ZANCU|nr:hypothetical protein AX774_g4901 [Zancudomyces culisetae]|eukprot:OMH81638.1 hypothetical protein AX774_g4901 [Zancudomyces culisetae]
MAYLKPFTEARLKCQLSGLVARLSSNPLMILVSQNHQYTKTHLMFYSSDTVSNTIQIAKPYMVIRK